MKKELKIALPPVQVNVIVVTIRLTEMNNVEFTFRDGSRQIFKNIDVIDLNTNGLTIRVYDESISRRGLQFTCDQITEIDIKGDVTTYTPITEARNNKSVYKARYDQVVTKLIDGVFNGGAGDSDNTGMTTVNVLDSGDVIQETADANLSETVKVLTPGATIARSGSQIQITCPTSVLRPQPISHNPPTTSTPFDTNDYIDLFNNGEFDFWIETSSITTMRLGSDKYTLHTDTLNPNGTTHRFTATDGTPPTTGANFTTFGSGVQYVVCDWYHRVMWYVANLGDDTHADALVTIQNQNTAVFAGYTDWFAPTLEIIRASGHIDTSVAYYNSPNMFLRGVVSGVNDTRMWSCEIPEIGSTNAMAWWDAYDYRRTARTSSTNNGVYMCRTIKDADITALFP